MVPEVKMVKPLKAGFNKNSEEPYITSISAPLLHENALDSPYMLADTTYTFRTEASGELVAALGVLVLISHYQMLAFDELHVGLRETVVVHESAAALGLAIGAVAEDGALICASYLDLHRFAEACGRSCGHGANGSGEGLAGKRKGKGGRC